MLTKITQLQESLKAISDFKNEIHSKGEYIFPGDIETEVKKGTGCLAQKFVINFFKKHRDALFASVQQFFFGGRHQDQANWGELPSTNYDKTRQLGSQHLPH